MNTLPHQLRSSVLLLLLCLAGPAFAEPASPIALEVRPIEHFRIGSTEERFGPLRFIGGLEISSRDRTFGQISGLRFIEPGGKFLSVADHGYWFSGRFVRDEREVPVGIEDPLLQPMLDRDGTALPQDKHRADAEGLAIAGGRAFVSFERDHRVEEYRLAAGDMGASNGSVDFLIPRGELRYNAGLETIVATEPDGPHQGALIVVAERSIDRDGNIFAAILDGPHRGIFKVERTDGYDVTDGAMLPDGDLLLLERRFTYVTGVAMRLRRVPAGELRAGALARGEILYEAGMTHRIDNMEALDVWRRDDGRLIVSMMSDDNQSFLQRTLYLEFELEE